MLNKQPISNNTVNQKAAEYKHKTCAGWNCKDIRIHFFKMSLSIGSLWLCDSCQKYLEKDGWILCTIDTINSEIANQSLKVQTEDKKMIGL
jgi:hypothetical protein